MPGKIAAFIVHNSGTVKNLSGGPFVVCSFRETLLWPVDCAPKLASEESMMILCIDDETIGLLVRKAMLQSQGYQVLTATTGPEGLDLFAANPVDAVVLDYSMPGMNGGQIAAELKRRNPRVKILLLTAYVDLSEEALRWVDKRTVKGVSPTVLLEDLKQLLAC